VIFHDLFCRGFAIFFNTGRLRDFAIEISDVRVDVQYLL
jgi:hypothetical protein